jgi:ADP-L-glycero-D-manno-heptose 6-epimerase
VKILVTGHRGFIGSHLVAALSSSHDVSTFEWGEPLPTVAGLDWVIHVGAISSTTFADVEQIMRQNVDFTLWLYNQCRKHGVNLQWASSASVYGPGTNFSETAPPDPRTPYAWTKYIVERHIECDPAPNIHVQGFRYFNVYGSGEEHKGSQASPFTQFRLQAEQHGEVTVFENSHAYQRDFVPVEEVVRCHQRFFAVPESGIFNIGTGTTLSFRQVANSFGVPVKEIPMPPHLKHSYQTWTCADMTKTDAALERYCA